MLIGMHADPSYFWRAFDLELNNYQRIALFNSHNTAAYEGEHLLGGWVNNEAPIPKESCTTEVSLVQMGYPTIRQWCRHLPRLFPL